MFAAWHKLFILVVSFVMVLIDPAYTNNSRPSRNLQISNIADALKYLQDLDTYYGDRARVRFGKRGGPLLGDMGPILDDGEMY